MPALTEGDIQNIVAGRKRVSDFHITDLSATEFADQLVRVVQALVDERLKVGETADA